MRISVYSNILQKWKYWSLTPSKILTIIFFETFPSFPSRSSKIINFHVFHKKTPKLKTNTCKFLFFSKQFQKCKKWCLTPSQISIIIFLKTILRFLSRASKIINFHVFLKKTPKLKTNTCKFLGFFKQFV